MINLLPGYIKADRAYGRKNVSLLKYSVALLGTAISTAIIMMVSLNFIGSEEPFLRDSLSKNQTTVATLEKEIKEIEEIANRLDTAKQIKDSSINFSEVIPNIGASLPDGVVLNALSLTGGVTDPLRLDVDLISAELAPILIRNLVESELFEAADISFLSPKGDTASSYLFTASLSASFKGTAEAIKKAEAAAAAAAKKAAAAAAEKADK